jgi:uncharacterized protein
MRARSWHLLASLGLAAWLAAGLGAGLAFAQPGELRLFRIATGGPSGIYYVIGGILADALSRPPGARPCREDQEGCGVAGLVAIVQSTAGSVANVEGLRDGRFESAFVQADVADAALHAQWMFEGEEPARELRAIASLYPEALHLVAHPAADVESVADLRGKRVAVDEPGSGTLAQALLVLKAAGLRAEDIEPVYVKHGPALAMMRRGELDAMFAVGGAPLPPVTEAIREFGAWLVPIEGAGIEAVLSEYPLLVATTIDATVYSGMPDIPTIAVRAAWLVTERLSEDLAYDLARILFEPTTLARLGEGHPQGRHIRLVTALAGLPVPLHPGAERFYRERGL